MDLKNVADIVEIVVLRVPLVNRSASQVLFIARTEY